MCASVCGFHLFLFVYSEIQIRMKLSSPRLAEYHSAAIQIDEESAVVGQGLGIFSNGVPVQLPVTETKRDSLMHALSFAIRGCLDSDGTLREALETASNHADSFVVRQWAHRNVLASGPIGSYSSDQSKETPRLFGPPMTVSGLRYQAAELFIEDEKRRQNKCIWLENILPLHLFIAANTLRRPIIIFEVDGESESKPLLQRQHESRSLEGVYLPVSCSPDTCIGDPILLLHRPDGFDLEGVKSLEVTYISTRLNVILPKHNILDQWFAPILPQLPLEGESVPIFLHESMPVHYLLEDENRDEILGMYLYKISIDIGGGILRHVVRYPILDPVCTHEGFVAPENNFVPPPSVSTPPAFSSKLTQQKLPPGRLISATGSNEPVDDQTYGVPSTINEVLASAAGVQVMESDVQTPEDENERLPWWNWFRFERLWNLWVSHDDDDAPAEIQEINKVRTPCVAHVLGTRGVPIVPIRCYQGVGLILTTFVL